MTDSIQINLSCISLKNYELELKIKFETMQTFDIYKEVNQV